MQWYGWLHLSLAGCNCDFVVALYLCLWCPAEPKSFGSLVREAWGFGDLLDSPDLLKDPGSRSTVILKACRTSSYIELRCYIYIYIY